MSAICDGCGKAAMYTVKIGKKMSVCEECIDKAKDQLMFETWIGRVDQYIGDTIGVGIRDLPDVVALRDLFDDEMHPDDAAYQILQEAGWDT